jgi:hypothetical protein
MLPYTVWLNIITLEGRAESHSPKAEVPVSPIITSPGRKKGPRDWKRVKSSACTYRDYRNSAYGPEEVLLQSLICGEVVGRIGAPGDLCCRLGDLLLTEILIEVLENLCLLAKSKYISGVNTGNFYIFHSH